MNQTELDITPLKHFVLPILFTLFTEGSTLWSSIGRKKELQHGKIPENEINQHRALFGIVINLQLCFQLFSKNCEVN